MLYIIYLIFIVFIIFLVFSNSYNIEYFEEKPPFPIDIVYTWAGEKQTNNIRNSNNNELKYSLKSVLKYLPWVNNIYILMNPPKKRSEWMNNKKIILVDETETFPNKDYLPNSNSNAIETTLENIPNLNEHFIYFNDDFFVGKYLPYTYFFTKEGKAIVSHRCKNTVSMTKPNKDNNLNFKLPNMVNNFYPHVPISLLKSELIKYHNEYADYIDWVRRKKTRKGIGCEICTENNLECPCQQQHFIIANYMYKNNKAVLKSYKESYINLKTINKLDRIKTNPPPTFCVNDAFSDNREFFRKKLNSFFKDFYD